MTYHVVIEPTAAAEIRGAVRWITENRSPSAAARWYIALQAKVSSLESRPNRCPTAAEDDQFPEVIRELLFGRRRNKYRVVFTIRSDTVHVLYVRHTARDELEP